MLETEFNFVRGTTYSRNFNISNYPYSIDEIYFTVKESETDRLPVFRKKLGSGITRILTEEEGVNAYNLLINSASTENLKINKPYYFDVKVITRNPENTIKKVVIKGTMTLEANITRAFNES